MKRVEARIIAAHMKRFLIVAACAVAVTTVSAGSVPVRARGGMVASQNAIASKVGADVIGDGGTAIDAAVATAFALAVVHPTAGNIGGGGFLLSRPPHGPAGPPPLPPNAPPEGPPARCVAGREEHRP